MSIHHESTGIDREARIQAIAYTMWEDEGRPDGKADEHWLRACELVDLAEGNAEAILDPAWLKRPEAPEDDAPVDKDETAPEVVAAPLSEAIRRLRNAQAA